MGKKKDRRETRIGRGGWAAGWRTPWGLPAVYARRQFRKHPDEREREKEREREREERRKRPATSVKRDVREFIFFSTFG